MDKDTPRSSLSTIPSEDTGFIDALGESSTPVEPDDNELDMNDFSDTTPEQIPKKKKTKLGTKTIENEDEMLTQAITILNNAASAASEKEKEKDECYSYGNYVGNKLRTYSDKTRSAVQHAISDIIYRADQGLFEPNYVQSQNMYPVYPQYPSSVFTPIHSSTHIETINPNIHPEPTTSNFL